MRVLLVEDRAERIAFFERLYCGHAFLSTTTGERAAELLQEGPFDLLHLDYSLSGAWTGADVARMIATMKVRPRVMVHSENLMGVMSIQTVLPEVVYVPFRVYETRERRIRRLKEYLARPSDTVTAETVVAIISGNDTH